MFRSLVLILYMYVAVSTATQIKHRFHLGVRKPYIVAIESAGEVFCTGTIINPVSILTTAHCAIKTNKIRGLHVRVPSGRKFDIKTFIIHPDYTEQDLDPYDVAIGKLDRILLPSDRVREINSLPDKTPEEYSGPATFYGWTNRNFTHTLNKLAFASTVYPMEIISQKVCENLLHTGKVLTKSRHLENSQFCTRPAVGNRRPCYDDEGGPLLKNGTDHQIGLLSYFDPACMTLPKDAKQRRMPHVFIRLSFIINFIDTFVFGLDKM